MPKYMYEGPVMEFETLLTNNWKSETIATTEWKARSNFRFQVKTRNNRSASSKFQLTGKIEEIN